MLCCAPSLNVWLFATPWTVACQAPLSMGFSKQEYWSGLPFPPAGDLPQPGTELVSPTLVGIFFTTELPGKPLSNLQVVLKDCCCDQDKRDSSPQRTNTKVLAPTGDFRELHCNSEFHPEGTGKGALTFSGERECVCVWGGGGIIRKMKISNGERGSLTGPLKGTSTQHL